MMKNCKVNLKKRHLGSSRGASLIEYAVIVGLLSITSIAVVAQVGGVVENVFVGASDDLEALNNGTLAAAPPSEPPVDPTLMVLRINVDSGDSDFAYRFLGDGNGVIDWGDGNTTNNTAGSLGAQHTYATAGNYTITYDGSLSKYGTADVDCYNHDLTGSEKLVAIDSFGDTAPSDLNCAFAYTGARFTSVAQIPSSVNDLGAVLAYANSNPAGVSAWDVSNVTRFNHGFDANGIFNQDLSGWNVANADNFSEMFRLTNFSPNIGGWDVSKVVVFEQMFASNPVFNDDISGWNIAAGEFFPGMFEDATSFNRDISGWNMANTTYISWMLNGATSFNQDLSNWETTMNATICQTPGDRTDWASNTPAWVLAKPNWVNCS